MDIPKHLKITPSISPKNQTIEQLIEERQYWNYRVENATGWGMALTVAAGFLNECDTELLRRFS